MMQLVGVILAGGLSSRMGGGDKGLLPLGQGTVLDAVLGRIGRQLGPLAINANGNPARFTRFGLPVFPDGAPGFPGPLAGVLAAIDWALGQRAKWVVTVPSDTPFLPRDLVAQLSEPGASVVIASTEDRLHPTCALWSVTLRDDLAVTLAQGHRKVRDFTDRHGAAVVAFDPGPPDPFFNINSPADLEKAKGWL